MKQPDKKDEGKKFFSTRNILIMVAAMLLIVIGVLWYFIFKDQNKVYTKAQVINMTGEHVLLPDGDPTLITVDDEEQLKENSPVYENVKVGDVILVYPEKLVIYDPKEDIVVNMVNSD